MANLQNAKNQLDKIIKKSRVHFYKPIQIAEILREHRENHSFNLSELESYRNNSKKWRDQVSQKIVGRICTSSARFQDNLFEANAMPPYLIAILAKENEKSDRLGIVESYIYYSFEKKMKALQDLEYYISKATSHNFKLKEFIDMFKSDSGLKRSIDKAYEMIVYALFAALVQHLKATVTIRVSKANINLLNDFEDFTRVVLGVTYEKNEITIEAKLYRVGVANAADRGLDMWANFGPAVQIKHLSLTEDIAEDIINQVSSDRIIIVCRTAEKLVIKRILKQLGFSDRIQGIITQYDLERWYSKCLSRKYNDNLGKSLFEYLHREFISEFPLVGGALSDFINDRGYNKVKKIGLFKT
jgi:type II restriction enzyme